MLVLSEFSHHMWNPFTEQWSLSHGVGSLNCLVAHTSVLAVTALNFLPSHCYCEWLRDRWCAWAVLQVMGLWLFGLALVMPLRPNSTWTTVCQDISGFKGFFLSHFLLWIFVCRCLHICLTIVLFVLLVIEQINTPLSVDLQNVRSWVLS